MYFLIPIYLYLIYVIFCLFLLGKAHRQPEEAKSGKRGNQNERNTWGKVHCMFLLHKSNFLNQYFLIII